jgi:hypothetical protein
MKINHCFKRRFLATVTAIGVSLCAGPVAINSESQTDLIDKSKTATELDSNNDTTVTLNVPSAEYQSKADIVFLLDKSSSTDNSELVDQAKALVEDLSKRENTEVKISVVEFAKEVTVKQDLTVLTADNKNTIEDSLNTTDSSGTNIYGAVKKGEDILASDSTLDNNKKYLVLLTDGGSTYYSDDEGTAMRMYVDNGSSLYGISNYDTWIKMKGKYSAEQCANYNADSVQALITKGTLANGVQGDLNVLGKVGNDYSDCASSEWYLPKTTAGTYQKSDYTTGSTTSAYVTQLEKGFYLVGNELLNAKNQGYNVTGVSYPYHSSTDSGTSQTRLAGAFMDWIDQYVGPVYDYDSTDAAASAEKVFASIKDQIINLLDSGTVTDTIADNFDLVEDGDTCPFTLAIGGKEVSSTNTGTNEWSFGEADASGVYPYVVKYEEGSDEKFVWQINTPILKDAKASLSYKLHITASDGGTYDTNGPTYINYKDSTGKTHGPENFVSPTVTLESTPTPTPTAGATATPTATATSTATSKSPDTSDNSSMLIWAIALIVAAAGIGGVITLRRKLSK